MNQALTMLRTHGTEYCQNGDGEPVIFLHGIGGSAHSFSAQLSELTQFRCIAWNMPGYGGSAFEPWPLSFDTLSVSLSQFIEQLGFESVHLVGQSIGGMLAIEHALKQPQQVRSLTLIATTSKFGGPDDSFKHSFLEARLKPLEQGLGMHQLAAKAAPQLVGSAAKNNTVKEIEQILAKVSEKTWRGVLECLVTFDRRDDVASLSAPCCLVAGEEDKNAPMKTMKKMSEKIPNAEFHVISTAGHMVNQEAPAQVNALLAQFIGSHTV